MTSLASVYHIGHLEIVLDSHVCWVKDFPWLPTATVSSTWTLKDEGHPQFWDTKRTGNLWKPRCLYVVLVFTNPTWFETLLFDLRPDFLEDVTNVSKNHGICEMRGYFSTSFTEGEMKSPDEVENHQTLH